MSEFEVFDKIHRALQELTSELERIESLYRQMYYILIEKEPEQ